jgi:hypothetical protein
MSGGARNPHSEPYPYIAVRNALPLRSLHRAATARALTPRSRTATTLRERPARDAGSWDRNHGRRAAERNRSPRPAAGRGHGSKTIDLLIGTYCIANAIGNALAAAHALIETNAFDGYRRVIDFSGDSAYSFGGMPVAAARGAALAADIVINGLAILCRAAACSGRPVDYDLEAAFAATITGGPGSFVVTADRDDRFAFAVRRKLILEIAGRPIAVGDLRSGGTTFLR